jgi:hypothetical protein
MYEEVKAGTGRPKIYFSRAILELNCNCHPNEAGMHVFHRVAEKRVERGPPTEITAGRLSLVHSLAVIAGLSALCWAVLIAVIVALRAVL